MLYWNTSISPPVLNTSLDREVGNEALELLLLFHVEMEVDHLPAFNLCVNRLQFAFVKRFWEILRILRQPCDCLDDALYDKSWWY